MVAGDTAVRGRRASFEAKDARLVGCHPAWGVTKRRHRRPKKNQDRGKCPEALTSALRFCPPWQSTKEQTPSGRLPSRLSRRRNIGAELQRSRLLAAASAESDSSGNGRDKDGPLHRHHLLKGCPSSKSTKLSEQLPWSYQRRASAERALHDGKRPEQQQRRRRRARLHSS